MDFTAIAWTCSFQPSSASMSKKDLWAGSLDCQGPQGHVKIGPSLHPKDQRVFITQQLFLWALCSAAGSWCQVRRDVWGPGEQTEAGRGTCRE